MVLWCEWMKIFGRYLHHEGGNCQKSYFEVFSRAGSDWPLCKISTLTATPFMFFVHKYLIFDKYLTEIFSLNLWSVFQLSQTASDGFDWNWVKSGPLLFVIFQILNAMDRPIVHCPIRSHIASTVILNSRMKTSSTTNIVNIAYANNIANILEQSKIATIASPGATIV